MSTQYYCRNENRRAAVREAAGTPLNGIDYLELTVDDMAPYDVTLEVHFIHNLPGQADAVPNATVQSNPPDASQITITGGRRITHIEIDPDSISVSDNILSLKASNGDYSNYTLALVDPNTGEVPGGYDPQLSEVAFNFKVDCPSKFDCRVDQSCPAEVPDEPELNYLAKDYASFRQLILDRLSVIMPDWGEDSPADLQMTLVELLAYVGDHLSYYQDAVATEAYLGTARKRTSIRRHARLLDYVVHDGVNARTWVQFTVESDVVLPPHTKLLTGTGSPAGIAESELEAAVQEGAVVFETMNTGDVELKVAHNEMEFYTWSDDECCLPTGATKATLRDPNRVTGNGLALQKGDVLIVEEKVSPTTGADADADPSHRHALRLTNVSYGTDPLDNTDVVEIEWDSVDAMPFPLCLSAAGLPSVSVALGNVVLADHGRTLTTEDADAQPTPSEVPDDEWYRPELGEPEVTWATSYDESKSATEALEQDPADAVPSRFSLTDDEGEQWEAVPELLDSDRFDAKVVVEVENDGTAHLRFGDDVKGMKPTAGTRFTATYRVGNGAAGNVGADSLRCVASDSLTSEVILAVRNPLAATGGTDAESNEQVRQFAPQAFRIQERAVTEEDWAEVAQRHSEVQKAVARFRWTGSWYTVFIAIDRIGGRPVEEDNEFMADLLEHLEKYRIAGYDLDVDGPIYVPLDIELRICADNSYFQSDIRADLTEVFDARQHGDGSKGFFHPDNFTFGQPVYLSQIYKAAMDVAGVNSVEVLRFQRWGKSEDNEIQEGILQPGDLEIVQLENDPSFPENGAINFEIIGGK